MENGDTQNEGTTEIMEFTFYKENVAKRRQQGSSLMEPGFELIVSGVSGTSYKLSWSWPRVLLDSSVFRVF